MKKTIISTIAGSALLVSGLAIAAKTPTSSAPAQLAPTPSIAPVATLAPAATPVATPDPTVPTAATDTAAPPTEVKQATHLEEGFGNMCYLMDDGTYTTVIIKDYEPTPRLFAFGGVVDPVTEAPANFTDAQAWCAAHDPSK